MTKNELELGYSRAKGYTLIGEEWKKHQLAFKMVGGTFKLTYRAMGIGLCTVELGAQCSL